MLKHLKARRFQKSSKNYAYGAYVLSPFTSQTPVLFHPSGEETPYETEAAEEKARDAWKEKSRWYKGKPKKQYTTYYEIDAKRAVIAWGPKKPKPWKRVGHFTFYRTPSSKWARRGRESIVVYDRKKNRHKWILATPVVEAFEGHIKYLRTEGQNIYISLTGGFLGEEESARFKLNQEGATLVPSSKKNE